MANTVVVHILGDTKGLQKALGTANREIAGFARSAQLASGLVTGLGMAFAATAATTVGAAAVASGAAMAMTVGIGGALIAFAAQNEQVKASFSGLKNHIVTTMQGLTAPLVQPLVQFASQARSAFDALGPSISNIVALLGPMINQIGDRLVPLAQKLGPMLESAFKAGQGPLMAFIDGLGPVTDGMKGFFDAVNRPEVAEFVRQLMTTIGELLPIIGQLLVALTPIGTQILEALTPAFKDLADTAGNVLIPILQTFADIISEHPGIITTLIEAFVLLKLAMIGVAGVQLAASLIGNAIAIGRMVMFLPALATGLWGVVTATAAWTAALLLNPITWIVIGIVALIAAIVLLIMHWDLVKTAMSITWDFIKEKAVAVWTFLKSFFSITWEAIKNVGITIWEGIKAYYVAVWEGIKTVAMTVFNAIKTVITTAWNVALAVSTAIWNGILAVLTGIWNGIKAAASAVFNGIKSVVTTVWNGIQSVSIAIWNGIKNAVSNAWNGIKNVTSSAINGVRNIVVNTFNNIVSFIRGLVGTMASVGADLIRGLINGIKSMASAAVNAAKSVVQGAVNGAKRLLRIGSPSKLFYQFGAWTGEGYVLGIHSEAKSIGKAGESIGLRALEAAQEQKKPFYTAGKTMGQQLAEGLASAAFLVNRVAQGMTGSLSSKFGSVEFSAAARNNNTGGRELVINVQAGIASPEETGRAVVGAIKDFERLNGTRWRD